ncbi:hypothetical protein EVAR_12449_1 [Eumeta japonica]|uniref:Uncharacterized protein n=1 Tax=Eumeta variegata TaxID=151549 RepID=A0A4C1TZH8_EUMVA|nr:hypothetical protein EVAR_12449_1 [Eumeta japonica]
MTALHQSLKRPTGSVKSLGATQPRVVHPAGELLIRDTALRFAGTPRCDTSASAARAVTGHGAACANE